MNRYLLIVLLLTANAVQAFPEIPFCPLGGPPGWFNRIFDDDDYRGPFPYYGPPYAPPPQPFYWQRYPQRPAPAYPGYPEYQRPQSTR